MTRAIRLSLTPVLFFALAALAHADTFTVTGLGRNISPCISEENCSEPPLITYSGTVTIDPTKFVVTSANIKATDGATSINYAATSLTADGSTDSISYIKDGATITSVLSSEAGTYLQFVFQDPNAGQTYAGGQVTLATEYYGDTAYGAFTLLPVITLNPPPVDITPTAATPEPSSLILLGSGILGVAGAARRRFLA